MQKFFSRCVSLALALLLLAAVVRLRRVSSEYSGGDFLPIASAANSAELRGWRHHALACAGSALVLLAGLAGADRLTTWAEDRALWEALPSLPARLDWPASRICLGISRKRFTAHMAGTPDLPPALRDSETFRLHMIASEWGFDLFRTHHMKAPA